MNILDQSRASVVTGVRGVDSGRNPLFVSGERLVWAKNMSLRNGVMRPRPKIQKVAIYEQDAETKAIEESSFPSGHVQSIGGFSRGEGSIVANVEGRTYNLKPHRGGFVRQEITIPGSTHLPWLPHGWSIDTGGFYIIQNGHDAPLIFNGAALRKASADEVPVGRQMAFGYGRLWVVDAGGRSVVAGDIRQDNAGSHLKFTETTYLYGGGGFEMPDDVQALGFIPLLDTQTGFGPLVVFGREWAMTLRADITSRDQWPQTQNFQTIALPVGCWGQGGLTAVNQDLYFRSDDGIRSYRTAKTDLQGPGNVPLSQEAERALSTDSELFSDWMQSVLFDNRLLMAFGGRYINGYPVFAAIAPLDFSPTSSLGQESSPNYEGEWAIADNVFIRKMFTARIGGRERCFIVGVTDNGVDASPRYTNDLYEVLHSRHGVEEEEPWYFESRAMAFESLDRVKRLVQAQVFASDIRGTPRVSVLYARDHAGAWTPWMSWQGGDIEGPSGIALDKFAPPAVAYPEYEADRKTYDAEEAFDGRGRMSNYGHSFRVRVEGAGRITFSNLIVYAQGRDKQTQTDL